jgi:hypothetical protein
MQPYFLYLKRSEVSNRPKVTLGRGTRREKPQHALFAQDLATG